VKHARDDRSRSVRIHGLLRQILAVIGVQMLIDGVAGAIKMG
jgi:small neutral amino acid transporter SnatA (MarC family)